MTGRMKAIGRCLGVRELVQTTAGTVPLAPPPSQTKTIGLLVYDV